MFFSVNIHNGDAVAMYSAKKNGTRARAIARALAYQAPIYLK